MTALLQDLKYGRRMLAKWFVARTRLRVTP